MNKLSALLQRLSTGPLTLAALAIFLLFTALVLPGQSAKADEVSADAGTPDLSLTYSAADLYSWAEAYGPEGRAAYVHARLTFDVAWPLVYTFFLVTALSWLGKRGFPADSRWQQINLVPLLAALFDFLENAATSLVMLRFPDPTPVIAELAPVFTLVKWLLVGGAFALLLIALGAALWKRVRKANP